MTDVFLLQSPKQSFQVNASGDLLYLCSIFFWLLLSLKLGTDLCKFVFQDKYVYWLSWVKVCVSEWLVDISGHRRAARSIWIPNCNCMNGAVPCNQGVTQEKGNRSENYHMKSAWFLSLGWPAGKECFKMPLSSH